MSRSLAGGRALPTFVLVTGFRSLLGLGPAIYLAAAALSALPVGRAMDRFGRVPVIATGFALGSLGCTVTAARVHTGIPRWRSSPASSSSGSPGR